MIATNQTNNSDYETLLELAVNKAWEQCEFPSDELVVSWFYRLINGCATLH